LSQATKLEIKFKIMKKFLALAFLGIFVATLVSSCGSRGGHCEAYGSLEATEQSGDLASK